jgi:hypothetical protein
VRVIAPDVGAELIEDFIVERERWAVVDFWAGPEESETPRFTWFIQGEPIGFAQVDHQALAQ